MHDQWVEDAERSRPSSRRNSGPFSRRGSVKKEEKVVTAPVSSSSTPKKIYKPPNLDFVVTGKQLLKSRGDRANSMPGAYHRRQSAECLIKSKRTLDSPRRVNSRRNTSSLECDTSLDLSQVSDFEDTSSKYGIKNKIQPQATSTPKKCQKSRSYSLQKETGLESKRSRESISEDSFQRTPSSGYSASRQAPTELDYSSMSPECSGHSSGDSAMLQDTLVSPRSQDFQDSSFCVSTYQEEGGSRETGEWGHFWANYNNSLARVPISRYYDQCPTPYRSDIDLADFEFSTDGSRKRSPDNIKTINSIIRNEGLRLTPRETQNIIKCAHILGNVLTKAIERQTKEITEKFQELNPIPPPEKEMKKKAMTLDLKETVIPLGAKKMDVPTQTDISLPNTKTAPIIFENILRQLSMSSLDVKSDKAE